MPSVSLSTPVFNLPYPVGMQYGAAATQALAEVVSQRMFETRLDYLTTSGVAVTSTSSGGDAVITWGRTYIWPPVVTVSNGEPGMTVWVVPWTVTETQCWVKIIDRYDNWYINGVCRLLWVAHGLPQLPWSG